MAFESDVAKAVAHWSKTYGVAIPEALVHGILEKETRHGTLPYYVANHGIIPEPGGHHSYGPMQVYDDTVATLNPSLDPAALAKSPALGIWYGVHWLARLIRQFPNDPAAVISAYNAGAGNARRNANGLFPNQPYVDAVIAFMKQSGPALGLVPVLALAAAAAYFLGRRRRAA